MSETSAQTHSNQTWVFHVYTDVAEVGFAKSLTDIECRSVRETYRAATIEHAFVFADCFHRKDRERESNKKHFLMFYNSEIIVVKLSWDGEGGDACRKISSDQCVDVAWLVRTSRQGWLPTTVVSGPSCTGTRWKLAFQSRVVC